MQTHGYLSTDDSREFSALLAYVNLERLVFSDAIAMSTMEGYS